MIVHADKVDHCQWRVWDCEACRFLTHVRWADDIENQYSVMIGFSNNKFVYKTISANVVIITESKIIFINSKQTKQELIEDFTDIFIERIGK